MTQGHRITVTPAELHVEVHVNGVKVAESDRPVLLEETGLPTRYYLPREHVREAHPIGVEHGAAAPRRESIAVRVDDVDVRRMRRDARL